MDGVFSYAYTPAGYLEITDEDAADFLQSQFSNDLRPFEPGLCRYGLWLGAKGKVLADGHVLCEDGERFFAVSEGSDGGELARWLGERIVADDVVVAAGEPPAALALIGENAPAALEAAGLPVPEAGVFCRADGMRVVRGRRARSASFEILFAAAEDRGPLRRRLAEAGVPEEDFAAAERERLRAGVPRVPPEAGPGDLPGEAGLDADAVSFTKGCFIGQEAVARMRNVGRPRRGLFLLEGAGAPPPCPVTLRTENDRKLGELRSAVADGDRWIGAGMLKLRDAAVGTVADADGRVATVQCAFRGTAKEVAG